MKVARIASTFLFFMLTLCACIAGEKVSVAVIGLQIELPDKWQQMDSKSFYENLGKVKIEDPEFQKKLATSANVPAVIATKFPEPYEKLNPSIKINARPYGNLPSKDAVFIAGLAMNGLKKAFADYKVVSPPTKVMVAGQEASNVVVRYTLKTENAEFPVESQMWLIAREHFFLIVGAGYDPADTESLEQIKCAVSKIELSD